MTQSMLCSWCLQKSTRKWSRWVCTSVQWCTIPVCRMFVSWTTTMCFFRSSTNLDDYFDVVHCRWSILAAERAIYRPCSKWGKVVWNWFIRSTDWLIDWIVAPSIDHSIDWLIDWLNSLPFDWLIDRLIDWVSYRWFNWLIDRLIDWLIDWSIDWLIDCLRRYGFSVLGLELSVQNVEGARVRAKRLAKQWAALRHKLGGEQSKNEPVAESSLDFSSCAVSRGLDLDDIVAGCTAVASKRGYLLCGLHTCGTLGNDLLDIFQRNESAKALVAVGCCYHAMSETYADGRHTVSGSLHFCSRFILIHFGAIKKWCQLGGRG